MTVNHFVIVIKHMWKKDWHQYRHGRILVQDHAAYMLFIYSSARVGEYFESNMRRGSGRGLLYEVSGLPSRDCRSRKRSGVSLTLEADHRLRRL
jgi:hypothetical protein